MWKVYLLEFFITLVLAILWTYILSKENNK